MHTDQLSDQSILDLCFYCTEYRKIVGDYPENISQFDLKDFTPRCYVHWQYQCNSCKAEIHFNGISWCSECKEFTCVKCSNPSIQSENFLIYDYYYQIKCLKCDKVNPCLDYAEFSGTHPYQIGDLRPELPISLWMPIFDENERQNKTLSGAQRIRDMCRNTSFTQLDSTDKYSSKRVWDKNAAAWGGNWPEGGDVNHKNLILPKVMRFINPQPKEVILDVACGEGTVARKLSDIGCIVTGVDISNMLDYAIKREKQNPLHINYIKIDAHDIDREFAADSFDKIICNMALMDIDNYEELIGKISYCLKLNGLFVFSITHPCLAWPITNTLRLPKDTQRNEDKIWIVDNYFDKLPTTIEINHLPSHLLHFPRTLSDYFNTLIKNHLQILEISEPKPSKDLIKKYPRDFFRDYDRIPTFMVVKTKKIK